MVNPALRDTNFLEIQLKTPPPQSRKPHLVFLVPQYQHCHQATNTAQCHPSPSLLRQVGYSRLVSAAFECEGITSQWRVAELEG